MLNIYLICVKHLLEFTYVYRKSRLKVYTTTESVMRLVTTLLNQLVLQLRYATTVSYTHLTLPTICSV